MEHAYKHVKKRVQERLGISLTLDEYRQLVARIRECRCHAVPIFPRGDARIGYRVWIEGKAVVAVYDSRSQLIVTVLPPHESPPSFRPVKKAKRPSHRPGRPHRQQRLESALVDAEEAGALSGWVDCDTAASLGRGPAGAVAYKVTERTNY